VEDKTTLKKELGVFSAMALVVGCVIGAGVFFKSEAIYTATGGAPGMGMLACIIGGANITETTLKSAEEMLKG
jgi:APA family basic amino acid/polyamine antiporter